MPKEPNESESSEPKAPNQRHKTWEEDQKKRGYYYDDAHGYQTYDAEDDDDPVDEIKKTPGHDSRPGVNAHEEQS